MLWFLSHFYVKWFCGGISYMPQCVPWSWCINCCWKKWIKFITVIKHNSKLEVDWKIGTNVLEELAVTSWRGDHSCTFKMEAAGSSKRQGLFTELHGITLKNTAILIQTTIRISNLTKPITFCGQDTQYFNVKTDGMYQHYCALKA